MGWTVRLEERETVQRGAVRVDLSETRSAYTRGPTESQVGAIQNHGTK